MDPYQSALIGKFLTGTTDAIDLGNGGGATAQTLAFLGREDLVMGRPFSHNRSGCRPLLDKGAPVDPVAYVANRAAGYRVTMVNEAHDMPQSRAFDAAIAVALWPEGYRWYGAETFSADIGKDRPAWPLLTDGFYAAEPIFGRLIRNLRRLGYQLFAYEFQGMFDAGLTANGQMARREQGQADNLAARMAQIPPREKILVHVGYGHLMKDAPPDAPTRMMAQRFREKAGIDPLTVDQTSFWSSDSHAQVCDPAKVNGGPGTVYIAAPRPAFTRRRPSWRLQAGDRFVDIPGVLKRPDTMAIYEARLVSEPDIAVPMDRLMLRPGEDLPLLLPPGRYRVTVWTQSTGWSESVQVKVHPT